MPDNLQADQADQAPQPEFFISPQDRDLMIRITMAEAGNQPDVGHVAVAHSILNRVASGRYGGDNPTAVIKKPWAYEPWSTRRAEVLGYSPDSPAYQRTASLVDGVLSGELPDPTGGMTHFYSPGGQAAKGRGTPAWASKGPSQKIFDHVFVAPEGLVTSYSSMKGQATGSQSKPTSATATAAPASTKPQDMADDELEALLTGGTTAKPAGSPAGGRLPVPGAGQAGIAGSTPAPAPDGSTPLAVTVRPSGTTGAAAPAASSADPASMSDADLERMLTGGASDAKPPGMAAGAPTATKPQPGIGQRIADTVGSFAAGALDLPIVGPAIQGGLTRAAAGMRMAVHGEPSDVAFANAQNKLMQATSDHPWASAIGGVAGTVGATIPIALTAPGAAAFGITGAGWASRIAAGAGTGGLIGGTDSAVRSGVSPEMSTNPLSIGYDPRNTDAVEAGMGSLKGSVVGGAAVPLGAMIGAGVNKLIGAGRATDAVANVNRLLEASGTTPQEAQVALRRMGPQATLADLDPALTVDAGTLAARGGRPTSILKGAMAERAAGANNRVAGTIDELLGPKPNLEEALTAAQTRAQDSARPYYQRAYAAREGHDVTPMIADIDKRMNTATGGVADVLKEVRGYLVTKQGLPKISTDSLHGARQALDDYIQTLPRSGTSSAGNNALRVANEMRGTLDATLKRNTHMAMGDAAFASEMEIKNAIQEGTDLFTRKVRPEEFAKRVQGALPSELDGLRTGARVAIGDALEQASRGELAGAKSLFGAGSANRAKLRALFPQADKVLDALQVEAAMRATESRVAANSTTAERMASQARYQPPSASPAGNDLMAIAGGIAAGDPTGGMGPALAMRGARGVRGRMQMRSYDRLAEGTAERLAAMGDPRDVFMNQLIAGQGWRGGIGQGANTGTNLLMNAVGNTFNHAAESRRNWGTRAGGAPELKAAYRR